MDHAIAETYFPEGVVVLSNAEAQMEFEDAIHRLKMDGDRPACMRRLLALGVAENLIRRAVAGERLVTMAFGD